MKRILAFLLACMTVLALSVGFTGCKKDSGKTPAGTTDAGGEPAGNVTTGGGEDDQRPVREDFESADYWMVIDGGQDTRWYINDEDSDTSSVPTLSWAFYNRNSFLEEYFNINIRMRKLEKKYGMNTELTMMANSGADNVDVVLGIAADVMPSAIPNGLVADLNKLDGLNLGASYWDQRIQSGYQINGKLFTLEGDFTVFDELCTYGVLANGSLWGLWGYYDTYGSPLEVVKDGKWTYETMCAMFRDRSDLNNGSGEALTKDSKWGLLTESPLPYILYLGSGKSTILTQEDQSLKLVFTERTENALCQDMLDKLLKGIAENGEVLFADASHGVLSDANAWGEIWGMFANNQALFYTTTLSSAINISGMMKDSFNVMPTPMYEEGQDGFYSYCSAYSHLPLMIPANALRHADRTAKITDAMGYFSRYAAKEGQRTVVAAEYEWLMINKICQTSEDQEMLELIFASKVFDTDGAMRITGVQAAVDDLAQKQKSGELSSTLGGLRANAMGNLTKFINNMNEKVPN